MLAEVTISERARKYGYIIWPKRLDAVVKEILGTSETVEIVFENEHLGAKRVDWKHRRISVGPNRTRVLGSSTSTFRLTGGKGKPVTVTCL